MGRIVSIDYGFARMGLAISDERRVIATSLGAIKAEKGGAANARKVLQALATYEVDEIVLGLPLHMDGNKGFMVDEVHYFLNCLKQMIACPIVTWDERLSTVQADRMLRETSLSRKKRSQVIDGVTAVIILQSYLDKLAFQKENYDLTDKK